MKEIIISIIINIIMMEGFYIVAKRLSNKIITTLIYILVAVVMLSIVYVLKSKLMFDTRTGYIYKFGATFITLTYVEYVWNNFLNKEKRLFENAIY